MKHKQCCKECKNSKQSELEKIMNCPLLTPEEKSEIILSRRANKLMDEFRRKYVANQEVE